MKKVFIFTAYLFAVVLSSTVLVIELILKLLAIVYTMIGIFLALILSPVKNKLVGDVVYYIFNYPCEYIEKNIWLYKKVWNFYVNLAEEVR